MSQFEKPPLGLKPRWVHDKQRLQELLEAMDRYDEAGKEIPTDWLREYTELSRSLIEGGHIR